MYNSFQKLASLQSIHNKVGNQVISNNLQISINIKLISNQLTTNSLCV